MSSNCATKPMEDEDIPPGGARDGVILNGKDVPQSDPTTVKKETASCEDPSQLLILKIWKIKFVIFKPLIPLKITMFIWFGVGALIQAFFNVYLKQQGMTIDEVSVIYIIVPAVQFLGSVIAGVIADKIGKSKPVLVVTVLLVILFLVGVSLVPSMNPADCENKTVDLRCQRPQLNHIVAEASCGIANDSFQVSSCHIICPEHVPQYSVDNILCNLTRSEQMSNFSLLIHVNSSYTSKKTCFYNVNSLIYFNPTYSWCNVSHNINYSVSCILHPDQKCSLQGGYRTQLYIATLVLVTLLMATISITYRFFDVTSMCLMNEYKKDFGCQRVWSILGVLIFSTLGGLVVSVTSIEGEPKNYAVTLYMIGALAMAALGGIWKLKVQIRAPGKHLWKKSLILLKNPDVISFIFILLIMGTNWGYTKMFTSWYLVDLKASSILIGLLPAMGSLYGLPFLQTSKWWIEKIGHTNIFLLALLCAMLNSLGYSFLQDPWWSIPLEVTQIFAYHLWWVAVIVHSHSLAPVGLTATVLASAGGIHFGVGKGFGSLIGGLSMKAFGGRTAFRIISVMCLATAVLYAVYLLVRRQYVKRKVALQTKSDADNINKEVNVFTLQDNQIINEKD